MQDLTKKRPFRSSKYLAWVRSLDCCICGCSGVDVHHGIGMKLGGMGTKAPDDMTMPLCRKCHSDMHNKPQLWYLQKGFIIGTKKKADAQGIRYEAP